ncbi:hypothetical protein MKW92_034995 [Papaver armeniacum]|nr:hypothetical protein MKW92_034995 [Papaver armeniacum]
MGFFAIYYEACKLTAANKKIFSQITLTILLPLAFFFLSELRISTYSKEETPGWLDYCLTIAQIVYFKLMFIFSFWSTSSVMYTIACFYTSRDITYKKVTGVLVKLRGELTVTFLWCFLFLAIYTSITFVVTVLENDCYGRKALAKTFAGIIFTYFYLSVYGSKKISMVGRVFVGIGCHFLMAIWIHILLVVHTVVYFVCKSYHNQDISTVSTHLEDIKDVPLEQVQVPV